MEFIDNKIKTICDLVNSNLENPLITLKPGITISPLEAVAVRPHPSAPYFFPTSLESLFKKAYQAPPFDSPAAVGVSFLTGPKPKLVY